MSVGGLCVPNTILAFLFLDCNYSTGWGRSRFTVVRVGKDRQVMMITTAFLTVFCMLTTVTLLFPHPVISVRLL